MAYSSELIKGTLRTILLKMLSDHSRMYGYEITQKVKELTADKILLTEGALYPALHALEADGLIKSESDFIGKRVRKYYRLSAAGKKAQKAKSLEFADFLNTMKLLLELNIKGI